MIYKWEKDKEIYKYIKVINIRLTPDFTLSYLDRPVICTCPLNEPLLKDDFYKILGIEKNND